MAEWYEFVGIAGTEPEYGTQIFTGIRGSTSGDTVDAGTPGDTEEPTPEAEKMPEGVWSAQNATLTAQSGVFNSMAKTYSAKVNELPRNFTISGFLGGKICEAMISGLYDFFADLIPGDVDDMVAKEVLQFGAKIVGFGIVTLEGFYNAGTKICEAMEAENAALLEMDNSIDNYRLRIEAYQAHELSLHSLMAEITNAERQTQMPDTLSGIQGVLKEIEKTLDLNLGKGSLLDGWWQHRLGDLPEIVKDNMEALNEKMATLNAPFKMGEQDTITSTMKAQMEALNETIASLEASVGSGSGLSEGLADLNESFKKALLIESDKEDEDGNAIHQGFLHDDLVNGLLLPVRNSSGKVTGYKSILGKSLLQAPEQGDDPDQYKSLIRIALVMPEHTEDNVTKEDEHGNPILKGVLHEAFLTEKLMKAIDGSEQRFITDEHGNKIWFGYLETLLKDLAYADIIQDYGNFATYLRGKMVEF